MPILAWMGLVVYVLGILFFLIISIGNSQSDTPLTAKIVLQCLAWLPCLIYEMIKEKLFTKK